MAYKQILFSNIFVSIFSFLLVSSILTMVFVFEKVVIKEIFQNTKSIKHEAIYPSPLVPVTAIPKRTWPEPYVTTSYGYRLPLLTTRPNGRLGNIMGEYATLYALHKAYNVSVVILPKMASLLDKTFRNLSLPIFKEIYNKSEWQDIRHVGTRANFVLTEVAAAGLLGPHQFIIQEYTFETQLFHAYESQITREFTFSDEILDKARAVIELARIKWQENFDLSTDDLVFVSFHVRRTDYIESYKRNFGGPFPGEEYYKTAMRYYTNKFQKVMFILASDDPQYLENLFSKNKDVYISVGLDSTVDMALISSCNHSITTVGSFGFWGAYLTGGEVVYPALRPVWKIPYIFSRQFYEMANLNRFTELPLD